MISIIIPVYNGEKYINNLFNKLKIQSNGRENVEVIFVDDGSTDNSLQILNSLKDSSEISISVYTQNNSGVSSARNTGMAYAKGDFITFIDVDDFVTADYFLTLEKAVINYDFDIFVFNSVRKKEIDNIISDISTLEIKYINKIDMLHRMCKNPTAYGVVNLLLSKKFVIKNGLQFALSYKYYEDYDFIYRAFGMSEKIAITEKILYFYVQHNNSAMHQFVGDRIECMELLYKLNDLFRDSVPEFYPEFSKWGINRIYWSVLWQAALFFKYGDFKYFAEKTDSNRHLKQLCDFPAKKVSLSSKLCIRSKFLYFLAVTLIAHGNRSSKKANISEFETSIENYRSILSDARGKINEQN